MKSEHFMVKNELFFIKKNIQLENLIKLMEHLLLQLLAFQPQF